MADAGIASRRECENYIASGRVSVNGKTVREMGTKVNPITDEVQVDGQTIEPYLSRTYLAFHKPRGILSTMFDPEGRASIGDFFSESKDRIFHVGRLDKESEGLILLTNDGDWANSVSHPSNEVIKTYQVLVAERVSPDTLKRIRSGVQLSDGLVRASRVVAIPGGFEIDIHEGRNQIVRRLAGALDLTVIRLVRVQVGRIRLGELPVGKSRNLSDVEVISFLNHKLSNR